MNPNGFQKETGDRDAAICSGDCPMTDSEKSLLVTIADSFRAGCPFEEGGILGSRDGSLCAFAKDPRTGSCSAWHPDTAYLDRVIQGWQRQGISFAGFVHSHVNGYRVLSEGDLLAARQVLEEMKQQGLDKSLWMMLVLFDDAGKTQILGRTVSLGEPDCGLPPVTLLSGKLSRLPEMHKGGKKFFM